SHGDRLLPARRWASRMLVPKAVAWSRSPHARARIARSAIVAACRRESRRPDLGGASSNPVRRRGGVLRIVTSRTVLIAFAALVSCAVSRPHSTPPIAAPIVPERVRVTLLDPQTLTGVGAMQGVEFRDGLAWFYGDA